MVARQQSLVINSPVIMLIVLILLYIAVSFWSSAGTTMIYHYFHQDKTPAWQWQAFYAIIFSFVVYVVLRQIDYPIIALQHKQVKGIFV